MNNLLTLDFKNNSFLYNFKETILGKQTGFKHFLTLKISESIENIEKSCQFFIFIIA